MDSTVGDSSDDEEVVHETDVYLSKALSENLYLFHYPTRNNAATFQDLTDCLSARIKPKQQKIELEFCIDVDAENYDTSRGEQIAYNVDGQNTTEDHYFKSGIMDKSLLIGSKILESNDNYAVGFMRNGELHITPLHSIIEMRPGFLHMDKFDNTSKKALNSDENVGEEEEAVAVTVRFEGPNAERDRQMRQKSYQYFQQKNSSEPWINLNYHKSGSMRSVSEKERLLCSQVHQDICRASASQLDYLKELVPESLRLSGTQSGKNEETAILSDKPLSDQIRHLMMNAHLLTFSMLEERLPRDIDSLSIERLLPQIGVLVQGCWAVKSELLYEGEKTVSAYTGVSAKHLISARNYILWLFKKTRFVTHSDVLSVTRLSNDDFKAMMTPLANKTNRGWEFKFPTDEEFLENHPAIRQSQDMKWDCRYKQLVQELKMSQSEGESSKASTSTPSRPRQKRHSHSSISEGDESGTESSTSGKTKRSYAPNKRTALTAPKHATKSKPFPIATLDISPTYLENSPPESVKSELRDYVGDALRQQFCLTFSEIKEIVLESHLNSIANRSDFEDRLDEALASYGAQKLKNKWPQNTRPESLYAFTKFGNKLDRYRAALLDLFSTTARTRGNLFVKKVEDELRERVSESDCRQIFEEYCVYKSGFYYLKGTIALDS